MKLKFLLPLLMMATSGCAVLYHVQISDLDNRTSTNSMVPFDIMVSETGVDVGQVGNMLGRNNDTKGGRQVDQLTKTIQAFQMGPRTGMPVFTDKYAEKIIYKIHQACPSGQVTGVVSVRENRQYAAISGEIVKVTGFCMRTRKPSSTNEVAGE